MKEQTNYDYEKYVQIAQMAKMGWWESDLKNKEYICSDFIVDLLGLESNRISFTEFHQRIREDHRLRLKNEYMSLSYLETYEQMFPIRAKDGEIWVYSKINFQKPDKEGYRNMTGLLQYIDRPIDTTDGNIDFFQVSNLLYQQTNISYSLLAFLQCDDVTQVVNKTLGDLLHQFLGDRIYIFEINRKEQRQDCTYEVTAEGISKEQEFLSNIPWDPSTWWNHQIAERRAIILNTLDDMPEEAAEYRQTLEMQDIKSLMVVPLISKEEVWGYMGIDMVRTQRSWSNVDYQCFSSLANIISICIELRKSELQAKEERLALDNSEKILRNIYKNLPAGVELYDKDGYLVDINDKELEIFGLSDKHEALGVNLFDNPNIPLEVKEKLRAKEDVNFSINYDFSKINQYVDSRRNGIINLNTKVTALYDSQNRFINYLFINIDTTETTNAYTKIQEFENLFLLIGDYAKVGFAHFNVLTRDGYAQDTWYRNLGEKEGIPMPQVIGVYAHVVPEDQAVLKNFVGEVKTGKATSLRKEVRVCRENGKYTWTSINVMVRDYRPQDGIIEMLCINYDITPLKETEQKLIIARDKAEELDRLKSAFLANMSHEIRTPLNAIVGFSQLLPSAETAEEKKLYSGIINQNSDILLQLINDILDLSKIEAGTLEYIKRPMNLGEVCRTIYAVHKERVKEGVTLVFDNVDENLFIEGDQNRIMQVITNFLTNASKFTYAGEIRLGFERTDKNIRVYVKDTGIGIEPEKVDHVFERFVKLNSFAQGTGLGLSICQMIIEKIGGEIGVTSELGKGSTFYFTIPYEEAGELGEIFKMSKTESKGNTVNRVQQIKKILVAEDVESNFILLKNLIGREYTLLWAKDGVEAIEMYKQYQPDLILMDIKMPRMDGLEATHIIRSYSKEVPIIALTAYAFETDKELALEMGCNDFVTKPVSKEALEKFSV